VIIHYLDVMRLAITPDETDPPLIVDANAMLPSPITLEGFKTVAWRNTKILQSPARLQVEQFAPGYAFDCTKP
jgi:hypothetical protein